jgi:SpoVK/Ycf46/Vps4 family AAA+-type ATPase
VKIAACSIFQQAQEHASGQRESNIVVIFIDDIDDVSQENQDSIRNGSQGVLQELFLQLGTIARQKQEKGTPSDAHVLLVAATNCLGACDSTLVRRFGAHLLVGLPTEHDRKEMFTRYVAEFDNVITHDEIVNLSKKTAGWSGLELKTLTREAAMTPMREYLQAARVRREKLQETGGRLPVPQEGMVSIEESSSSIPLRAVELVDVEKCYALRFDTAV